MTASPSERRRQRPRPGSRGASGRGRAEPLSDNGLPLILVQDGEVKKSPALCVTTGRVPTLTSDIYPRFNPISLSVLSHFYVRSSLLQTLSHNVVSRQVQKKGSHGDRLIIAPSKTCDQRAPTQIMTAGVKTWRPI